MPMVGGVPTIGHCLPKRWGRSRVSDTRGWDEPGGSMGTRSVVAAVSVALVSAGAAIYCYTRAEALHSEARWL
ncbi:hypothetical protein STIAU_7187, partial [Stigmatella aurantiaca DW4/3-1]